jgi:TPR repeat protein
MLLRGDRVNKFADNVSPEEARGEVPLVHRENEDDRATRENEAYFIARDPPRAKDLLEKACLSGSHVTSCHNLAVMFTHGDDGVPADEEKATFYKKKTQEQVHVFGGL